MNIRLQRALLAAALAFATTSAFAQAKAAPSPKDLFQGKIREGQYEVASEADLTGVPGIAKEAARPSEVKRRCMRKEEVARGVEPGKDCQVKTFKDSGSSAQVVMACKDGSSSDMKFTFGKDSFASDIKTTGVDEGKPFTSIFKTKATYIGPCP
jgi:hypothetical protein